MQERLSVVKIWRKKIILDILERSENMMKALSYKQSIDGKVTCHSFTENMLAKGGVAKVVGMSTFEYDLSLDGRIVGRSLTGSMFVKSKIAEVIDKQVNL